MDNLTHSLTAFTIARLTFPNADRRAIVAAIAAANLSDADVIVGWWGRAHYLLHHRGITHGIPGLLLIGLCCAGLGLWTRFTQKSSGDKLNFTQLWLLCSLAALSHLPLDWLNSYGVRPFLPFSDARYFGDLLFVVDPVVWMLLGLGLFVGVKWSRGQKFAWLLALSAGIFGSLWVGMFEQSFWIPWLLVLAVLLGLSYFFVKKLSLRTGPGIAVAAFALYLLGMTLAHGMAERLVRSTKAAPVQVLTQPTAGSPWNFTVIAFDATTADAFKVNLLDSSVEKLSSLERKLNDPALEEVKSVQAFVAWRSFARIPYVDHRAGMLVLGDARYSVGQKRSWAELYIPLP